MPPVEPKSCCKSSRANDVRVGAAGEEFFAVISETLGTVGAALGGTGARMRSWRVKRMRRM